MINGVTMKICVDDYILRTLKEDINDEDVSTNAVMPVNKQGSAQLICKDDGVICGLDVFFRTFRLLDDTARFDCAVQDGDRVQKGQLLGTLYGDIKAILSGERTALNYLQRMSGIATITREYMDELAGYDTVLLDTRKTTPNMRPFEKYAVKVGGATNHRYNLSDGVLLKDNHIGAAGSVTLDQVQEAVDAGADIIMLDNMDTATMKQALQIIDGRAQTECSGNVTKARLREIAETGVDFVSCGVLTHSAPILDLSLKNLTPTE